MARRRPELGRSSVVGENDDGSGPSTRVCAPALSHRTPFPYPSSAHDPPFSNDSTPQVRRLGPLWDRTFNREPPRRLMAAAAALDDAGEEMHAALCGRPHCARAHWPSTVALALHPSHCVKGSVAAAVVVAGRVWSWGRLDPMRSMSDPVGDRLVCWRRAAHCGGGRGVRSASHRARISTKRRVVWRRSVVHWGLALAFG